MSKRAFLFPGQGSQYVGMALDLFNESVEAKEMIKTADNLLGYSLSHCMFYGPEEELKQTKNTQPAIFLHSVVLSSLVRTLDFDGAAGHSLGEFSALVALGAIQFHEALQLVGVRGAAMQQAGIDHPGTMAAVMGIPNEVIESVCEEASLKGIVQCANFNSPGQVVISGSVAGVHSAMELCKQKGAKLVKELVVSGAFHSPLMDSAKSDLFRKIDSTNFFDAHKPVYGNSSALPYTDKNDIIAGLKAQITAPVLWEKTIQNMINDGYTEFVEVGPGKVLQGLVKRINSTVKTYGIASFQELQQYR